MTRDGLGLGFAIAPSLDTTINFRLAETWLVAPTVAGIDATISNVLETEYPEGKEYRVINNNESGGESLDIRDNGGTLLATITAEQCVTLILLDNSTASGTWAALITNCSGVFETPLSVLGYLVGGQSNPTTNYEFNPQLNQYSVKAASPVTRLKSAATNIGSALYMMGGESAGGPDTRSYDPDVWSAVLAPPPVATLEHTFIQMDSKGYRSGGNAAAGLTTTEEFDPALGATGTWTAKAARPNAFEDGFAAPIGSIGYYGDGSTNVLTNTFSSYDPSTNTWSVLAGQSILAERCPLLNLDGTLYRFGGFGSPAAALTTTQVYNEAMNIWETGPADSTTPNGRFGHAGAVIGGNAYVFGGEDLVEEIRIDGTGGYFFTGEFDGTTWGTKIALSETKHRWPQHGAVAPI